MGAFGGHLLCCFLIFSILNTLISIECTLCFDREHQLYDLEHAKLIISTIEGSLIIIRKLDGKILLNMKGRPLIEGYNYMKEKYELLLGTSKGIIHLKSLDRNDGDNKNITTSLMQLTQNGYEFSSNLISLTSQKDIVHFVDIEKRQVTTLPSYDMDSNYNNGHYDLAIKSINTITQPYGHISSSNDMKIEDNFFNISLKSKDVNQNPLSSINRFFLTKKSYAISVYTMEDRKELWRLNYITYPQLDNAKVIDDNATYFFSIHSNMLASLDMMKKKLNWIIRLDSHLFTIGLMYNESEFHMRRLPVNFVTEGNMREVLSRLETDQNIDFFKSPEFLKNQLRNIEILSDSNGVKLYFDNNISKEHECIQNCQTGINCIDDSCHMIQKKIINYPEVYLDNSIPSIIQIDSKNGNYCLANGIVYNIIGRNKTLFNNCYDKLGTSDNDYYYMNSTMTIFFYKNCYHIVRYIRVGFEQYQLIFVTLVIISLPIFYFCGKILHKYSVTSKGFNIDEHEKNDSLIEVENLTSVVYKNISFNYTDIFDHNESTTNVQFNSYLKVTVFKGLYKNKSAAIRRYENITNDNNLKDVIPSKYFLQELDTLNIIPSNKHIIKILGIEHSIKYSYIITELFTCSLHNFFHDKCPIENITFKMKINIIYQLLKGIKHVHHNKYVHTRLNPQNVLIEVVHDEEQPHICKLRVAISDFSSSRPFKDIQNMVFENDNICINSRVRLSKKDYFHESKPKMTELLNLKANDIYMFGMLALFIMCDGKFPTDFDWMDSSNSNEECLKSQFAFLNKPFYEEISDLIFNCISSNVIERYNVEQLSSHPIFWNIEKRGIFVSDVSNYIEHLPQSNHILKALEKSSFDIVKGNWINNLNTDVIADITRHRSYRGESLKDLLRVIRNKRNHFIDTIPPVTCKYKSADEMTEYFLNEFPSLILTVYKTLEKYDLFSTPHLSKFFYAKNYTEKYN